MLTNEEAQAIKKQSKAKQTNEKTGIIYLSKMIAIEEIQIQVATQTVLQREQRKSRFIKAETTNC